MEYLLTKQHELSLTKHRSKINNKIQVEVNHNQHCLKLPAAKYLQQGND